MILVVVMIIFIVGIVLIVIVVKEKGKDDGILGVNVVVVVLLDKLVKCDYLEEVKWVGFGEFFDKVKLLYYKFYFYVVYDDLDVIFERIKKEYVVYDSMFFLIKIWMDIFLNLLKEINKKDINKVVLKLREKKVVV